MHFRRKFRISYARAPVQVYIRAENYRIIPIYEYNHRTCIDFKLERHSFN